MRGCRAAGPRRPRRARRRRWSRVGERQVGRGRRQARGRGVGRVRGDRPVGRRAERGHRPRRQRLGERPRGVDRRGGKRDLVADLVDVRARGRACAGRRRLRCGCMSAPAHAPACQCGRRRQSALGGMPALRGRLLGYQQERSKRRGHAVHAGVSVIRRVPMLHSSGAPGGAPARSTRSPPHTGHAPGAQAGARAPAPWPVLCAMRRMSGLRCGEFG